MRDGYVYAALHDAVKYGIVEFFISLCKARPDLLFTVIYGKNLFHYTIEWHQEKVYSLIYGVGQRNILTTFVNDNSGNGMLHCAGMLSPLAKGKLDRIAGAALQMQRERQRTRSPHFTTMYKFLFNEMLEVESIVVQLSGASPKNDDGQKWMNETASSYTVVSALIITIMFAAVFTVPGGNNQETGFSIFLNEKLFMVFIISNAILLISSATSALMFLDILTSRYAEDDFLKS
ncbi:hypothetical protein ACFX16_023689 [Malus domestica]